MIYIDPSLEHAKREIDTVESYASNCSDFSLQTLYEALDIFAFAHFWGWLWVSDLRIRYRNKSILVHILVPYP